jgi:hypothetical protein
MAKRAIEEAGLPAGPEEIDEIEPLEGEDEIPPPPQSSSLGSTRNRRFCFTLNNYTDQEYEQLCESLGTMEYGIVAKELAPNTGTPHLQGYFRSKNMKSLKQIHSLPGMSRTAVFGCKGTEKQNRDYCIKGGDFIEINPDNFSTGQGARTDLAVIAKSALEGGGAAIREIAISSPEQFVRYSRGLMHIAALSSACRKLSKPPTLCFAYGPTGSGKSTFIHQLAEDEAKATGKRILYWGSEWPWISIGYTGEEIIVIDDIRDVDWKGASVPLNFVTRLVDVHPLRLQCKGSEIQFFGSSFYMSSVLHPQEMWNAGGIDTNRQFLRRITSLYECKIDPTGLYQQELVPVMPTANVQGFIP